MPANAGLEAPLLIDAESSQLGRVEARAELGEMGTTPDDEVMGQSLGVLDRPDGGDGIASQMGADQDGLVVAVADDADPGPGAQGADIGVELGAELGVFDVVDDPDEAFLADNGQPAPLRPQVGMIIGPIEQVRAAVLERCDSEKAAYGRPPPGYAFRAF